MPKYKAHNFVADIKKVKIGMVAPHDYIIQNKSG
jgi:hypothetical protein